MFPRPIINRVIDATSLLAFGSLVFFDKSLYFIFPIKKNQTRAWSARDSDIGPRVKSSGENVRNVRNVLQGHRTSGQTRACFGWIGRAVAHTGLSKRADPIYTPGRAILDRGR